MEPLEESFHAGPDGDVFQSMGLPHELQVDGDILGPGFNNRHFRWRESGGRLGGFFSPQASRNNDKQANRQTALSLMVSSFI